MNTIIVLPILLIMALGVCATIYLFVLITKALKRYIMTSEVRKEKKDNIKSLGEVIKEQRTNNKMTQEFVAESLNVSRQAVSKWESGKTDPSTSNLIALAKLFKISPEELLGEIDKNI